MNNPDTIEFFAKLVQPRKQTSILSPIPKTKL